MYIHIFVYIFIYIYFHVWHVFFKQSIVNQLHQNGISTFWWPGALWRCTALKAPALAELRAVLRRERCGMQDLLDWSNNWRTILAFFWHVGTSNWGMDIGWGLCDYPIFGLCFHGLWFKTMDELINQIPKWPILIGISQPWTLNRCE